jgi:hypothetical protein
MKPLGLFALVVVASLACSEAPPPAPAPAAKPIRMEYYSIGET